MKSVLDMFLKKFKNFVYFIKKKKWWKESIKNTKRNATLFFKDVFETLEETLLNNQGDIRLERNVPKKYGNCLHSIPTAPLRPLKLRKTIFLQKYMWQKKFSNLEKGYYFSNWHDPNCVSNLFLGNSNVLLREGVKKT